VADNRISGFVCSDCDLQLQSADGTWQVATELSPVFKCCKGATCRAKVTALITLVRLRLGRSPTMDSLQPTKVRTRQKKAFNSSTPQAKQRDQSTWRISSHSISSHVKTLCPNHPSSTRYASLSTNPEFPRHSAPHPSVNEKANGDIGKQARFSLCQLSHVPAPPLLVPPRLPGHQAVEQALFPPQLLRNAAGFSLHLERAPRKRTRHLAVRPPDRFTKNRMYICSCFFFKFLVLSESEAIPNLTCILKSFIMQVASAEMRDNLQILREICVSFRVDRDTGENRMRKEVLDIGPLERAH
jgi:hypothetical protein